MKLKNLVDRRAGLRETFGQFILPTRDAFPGIDGIDLFGRTIGEEMLDIGVLLLKFCFELGEIARRRRD
jgi:hypothetical protein